MNRRQKAYHLTMRSLFIALIIIQAYIPFLGYIPLGVINLTIIQITVIIASITLGYKDGMIIGGCWGLVKLLIAYTSPSSLMDTLVFRNPIVTVIPRILIGLFAGLVFKACYQHTQKIAFSSICAAIVGSLTNTCFLLGFMFIFTGHSAMSVYGVTSSNALLHILMTIAFTNGIPELIASAVITPLITKAIFKSSRLKPNHFA